MSARVGHGRTMWLHHGCRCAVCRRAVRDYSKQRTAVAAVRRGADPQTRVPAGRARRRLAQLRAGGLSLGVIAEQAGVSVATLERIQRGDHRNVALTTQTRLLAAVL